MPFKDKEKRKEYDKKWREANKQKRKQYMKKWREENKDYMKEYDKKYHQTPQGKKCKRITQWKHRGIITDNYDAVYEKYINTHNCEYCNCEFTEKNKRCLDHSHHITDAPNIRGILCTSCNIRDVYKEN